MIPAHKPGRVPEHELDGQWFTIDGKQVMVMAGMLLEATNAERTELRQISGQGKWFAVRDESGEIRFTLNPTITGVDPNWSGKKRKSGAGRMNPRYFRP